MARNDVLSCKDVTLDTSHLLMSALNASASLKAVVFGRKKKKKGSDVKIKTSTTIYQQLAKCEVARINTTKDHSYQLLARQDLLFSKVVTLDTSHLLMSGLNALVDLKAVEFGRNKKEG